MFIFPVPRTIYAGRFRCPNLCGRSYKYKNGLSQHLSYECGKQPMYTCPYCMKKCSLKGNMKKHMIMVHSQVADRFVSYDERFGIWYIMTCKWHYYYYYQFYYKPGSSHFENYLLLVLLINVRNVFQ